MASEVERDGFDGAMSSSAAPALRMWLPFWGGIEANDTWTARILAFFIPIVIILLLAYLVWAFYNFIFCLLAFNIESANRNEALALKSK